MRAVTRRVRGTRGRLCVCVRRGQGVAKRPGWFPAKPGRNRAGREVTPQPGQRPEQAGRDFPAPRTRDMPHAAAAQHTVTAAPGLPLTSPTPPQPPLRPVSHRWGPPRISQPCPFPPTASVAGAQVTSETKEVPENKRECPAPSPVPPTPLSRGGTAEPRPPAPPVLQTGFTLKSPGPQRPRRPRPRGDFPCGAGPGRVRGFLVWIAAHCGMRARCRSGVAARARSVAVPRQPPTSPARRIGPARGTPASSGSSRKAPRSSSSTTGES